MTGISVHVFSTLKSTLQASDEDCVFGLMFEEMLIGKNVCSIHKFDWLIDLFMFVWSTTGPVMGHKI